MPRIALNGVHLHYEATGNGPETIVFAHGLLWSGRMYERQVEHLRDRYACVTFDFRGQGESEVCDDGYDMDTLTTDAAAVIDRLAGARCHFVGLSMGGFVGLRLALRHPHLLRSLTLIDTAADHEPRANLPRYLAMSAVARVAGFDRLVPAVMKIMFGPHYLTSPEHAAGRREMEDRLRKNDVVGSVRATMGILRRKGVEDELDRIKTPTLVLHGEADAAIAERRARRMARGIRGARMVMIPRAGHTSTVEEPAAINRELGRFLGGLAPG